MVKSLLSNSMLEEVYCPHCNQKQWSTQDVNYVRLFAVCWFCDKEKWEKGIMTLESFERREKQAAEIK